MHLVIINGPNLNLLGKRERDIYGTISFDSFSKELLKEFPNTTLDFYQSNVEGELINKMHEVGFTADGIILNAGAYTHTSIAIADAIAAVNTPVIEIHISNVHKREVFRHTSIIAANCVGVIAGFGLFSYKLAIQAFKERDRVN